MIDSATGSFRKKNVKVCFSNLLITLSLILFVGGQSASAQGELAKISAIGSSISGVHAQTAKANQSQVVWYGGNWWGVFRKTSDGRWWVYKYNGSNWSDNVDTGISGGGEADMHVDETNGKLYVLVSTSARKVSRLSYGSGAWSRDNGFPVDVSISINADDPACITRASDGDLFICLEQGGNLNVLHSTNQGVTWTSPTTITTVSGSSLTDAIAFRYNSVNYIGLFVGDGEDDKNFYFYRLADGDDPTNISNWIQETLPSGPMGDADDHVNITRDADHNLYMIGKQGGSNSFYLFKRTNSFVWSYFTIEPDYGTRPSVLIDEDSNSLIIVGTVSTGSGADKIQCYAMNKNNLHNVGNDDWIVLLEDGSTNFNDATVSYQIHDNNSDLMVCASAGSVWYNHIDMSDITLPVFLASFQATSGTDNINLEWVTQSEVDNWEFIVLRQEEGEEEFREITRLPGSGTTNTATYYNYIDSDVAPGVTYAYRLANVDYNGQINYYPEIVRISLSPVATFKLHANYPNPFNAETNISFEVGQAAYMELNIYDASGRLVKRLFEGHLSPGSYVYKWNGKDDRDVDVASGVYFLNFSTETFNRSMRLVLSR